jgi:hypothetical protein
MPALFLTVFETGETATMKTPSLNVTLAPAKRSAGFVALATLILWSVIVLPDAHADDKGLELARRVDRANEGFRGEQSELEMVLINAHGDKTTRKMHSQVLEGEKDGDKSRIEFLWPADVKGTRMLTWTHKEGDDDQWLFLPSIKRVKRITSSNKSGSFMGSEFAYEDLGSQEVEKYTHTFLEDTTFEGRKVWKVQRVPVDPRSGYSKQVSWIDHEYMNPLKIEYYDRKGELLKTGAFKDYRKYGKLWRAGRIEMFNRQTKKASHLTWAKRKLQVELDEDDFESDELGGWSPRPRQALTRLMTP